MEPLSRSVLLVLASLLVSSTWAASLVTTLVTLSRSRPQNSLQQLESVIVQAVEGPLKEKWNVLLVDASVESLLSVDHVLETLHAGDHPQPLFLLLPFLDWQNQLPPPSVLSGRCAVVLVTASWPWWLAEAGDQWTPATLLVVNINSSWDATHLLEWSQIQLSTSLTLLEVSYTNNDSLVPLVYTSKPLSKNPQGNRLTKDLLGKWDVTTFFTREQLFPNRFQTFGGEVLHVASDLDDYPLIYKDGDSIDGTNIRILRNIGTWLNFSFTTTKYAEDQNWGELENGTWNGLLGEVYRGKKNITINYFTVVLDRIRDFDHTTTYFYEGFGFALRIPPPLPAWRSLFYPFTALLWASVGGSFLVITPTLYLISHASSAKSISLLEAAVEVLRSLVRQSSPRGSKVESVRLVLASWWVGALILVVSYTCNLIAVLTVPVFPPTISSIQDLATSNFRLSAIPKGPPAASHRFLLHLQQPGLRLPARTPPSPALKLPAREPPSRGSPQFHQGYIMDHAPGQIKGGNMARAREKRSRVSMVDYGEFVPEALATSQDSYLKALGDRMDLIFNYDDDDVSYGHLVQRVLDGQHAIVDTYSYLRNLLAEDESARGETYMVKEQVYPGALAFFLAKHTPWRTRLDEGIRRLVEGGLVNKWYSDIMDKGSQGGLQPSKATSVEKALTLSNLQGPFLLLSFGLLVASLAFLGEFFVQH